MRPISLSYTPADDSATGFASNVTGVSWALSATTPNDNLAHLVIINNDSVTDHSAKTALLTGTDADDKAQTETMALPGTSTTSTSTKYFKTLTSVVPSATIGADTMDIGWTDDAISSTIPLDYKANPFSVGIGIDVSGTINYTLQHTFANIYSSSIIPSTEKWFNHSSLVGATTDSDGNYAFNIMATRLLINSLTAGATIKLQLAQGAIT